MGFLMLERRQPRAKWVDWFFFSLLSHALISLCLQGAPGEPGLSIIGPRGPPVSHQHPLSFSYNNKYVQLNLSFGSKLVIEIVGCQ